MTDPEDTQPITDPRQTPRRSTDLHIGVLDFPDAEIRMFHSSEVEATKRLVPQAKEPEYVEWVRSLPLGVLWDVGANTGSHSLIANHFGHRVVALEPAAQNYARLVQNVNLNGAPITCLPIAASKDTQTGFLGVSSWEPGAALHTVNAGHVGHSVVCMSLFDINWFLNIPLPTYLKVDTDGYELQVLQGALPLLSGVESMMIERDNLSGDWGAIEEIASKAGLYVASEHPHGVSGVVNVVFRR